MNTEQLLQHFERISEAPDAIPRLRRFILDLAVRGKLVEQEPSDEKFKGIKKQDESAVPFDLPNNWEWIQIGDQLNLLNGMAFKSTDWITTGLRIVRIQNLNNIDATFNHCDPSIARKRSLIDNGSFLISWSGTPGTSFGAFIWERGPAVLNQHIFRCDFKTQSFIASFLRLAINGRLDEMISKAHGGVGLQHITKGRLEALLIPLPPLAEQHRIVAKVEELMNLCDQLEAARAEREQCRDNLVAASLQGLNQPAEEEDTFREHARFTFNNLPRITTRAAHIKQLRQTILNLAVRGKLVEQDPSDEKPKGIKRQDESAAPFNLPNNWEWIQIGDQLNLLNGIAFKSTDWGTTGLRIVRIQNLNNPNAAFNFCDPVISRERSLIDDGSFLISWSGTPGTSFGAFIWERGPAVLNQHIFRCDFKTQSFIASFLRLAINGRLDEMISKAHGGVGLQHITKGRLEALLIPLPPLAEQHRIVAKVEELMNLCDQMEAQITVTEQDSRRFLESVLADALAPAGDLSAEAQVA
jgi:type I restriction enzyme, S subunit